MSDTLKPDLRAVTAKEVHMGEMTIEECGRVIEICYGVVWTDDEGPVRG